MEITKKDIEKLIEVSKVDTYGNHLWNIFSKDYRSKGEIKKNEIRIWKQNMWNSIFYPIFTFELNHNNHLINISNKINPIAKLLVYLYFSGISYFIYSATQSEFDLYENWILTLILFVFLFTLTFVLRNIYLMEKRNQLDEIYEILEIEIEHKKTENEWSTKNILIRLFTYPFSLFLIIFNFKLIIPNGKYIMALITFGFVGLYLITDLKMIFRKKET